MDPPTTLSYLLGLPSPPFKDRISWRIFPIPPAPAVFDPPVIDVRSMGQEHIGNGAPVLVEAVSQGRDILP